MDGVVIFLLMVFVWVIVGSLIVWHYEDKSHKKIQMSKLVVGDQIIVWQNVSDWKNGRNAIANSIQHTGTITAFDIREESFSLVELSIPKLADRWKDAPIKEWFGIDNGLMFYWGQGYADYTFEWMIDGKYLPIIPIQRK